LGDAAVWGKINRMRADMNALISRPRLCTRVALVALAAMLFGVLAPTVSRAIAWQYRAEAALDSAVCSVDPAAHSGRPGPAGQASPGHSSVLEHCPFCSLHVPQVDLPPSISLTLLDWAPGLGLPETVAQAPDAPQVWAEAQPRAPPSLS
jgi:hypothetical protein